MRLRVSNRSLSRLHHRLMQRRVSNPNLSRLHPSPSARVKADAGASDSRMWAAMVAWSEPVSVATGILMYLRTVLLIAIVVSNAGVSAGQWYGGYEPVQSPQDHRAVSAGRYGGLSGGQGGYYQDKGAAFDDGVVQGVPSARGYRFREMESPAIPDNNLPRFRPSSLEGRPAYTWGTSSGQRPESHIGPPPVFRPLEPRERGNSQNQDLRNRYDRFGYQGLTSHDRTDHGAGGPDYSPESYWAPQW